MKDIFTSPFVAEFCDLIDNMYRLGWDERNGGNVSYILNEEEVAEYLDPESSIRTLNIGCNASALSGKIILVTGSGKYFKNIKKDPEANIGIMKINSDGKTASLLWGLNDGAVPTSELPTHLLAHAERLKADPDHRVVIHTHATNLVAMTFVHSLNEKEFTRTLWKMNTECLVVFPDGIGVLPWMVCGNEEIACRTAEKLRASRLVIWAMHGVIGVGKTLDDAFGLIETAEKAAETYFKISGFAEKKGITDEQLKSLASAFKVNTKPGYLD